MDIPDLNKFYDTTKKLIGSTIAKAIDDDILTQGAAIAFYTVFSVAPLFILMYLYQIYFLVKNTFGPRFRH